jgi:hypothetical protein
VKKRRRRLSRSLVDFQEADASLLELVDHLLNKGVVVSGDLVLGLAGVDLLYLHLSALLCASDRVLSRPGPKWRPR